MPISRFLEDLLRKGKLETYMQLLLDNYNPDAATEVMCRNMISVGWDGILYDCDFNQMLEMPIESAHISDLDHIALQNRSIQLDQHCFGCTAGSGSSCGGSLT